MLLFIKRCRRLWLVLIPWLILHNQLVLAKFVFAIINYSIIDVVSDVNYGITAISKIQLVVCYQCCVDPDPIRARGIIIVKSTFICQHTLLYSSKASWHSILDCCVSILDAWFQWDTSNPNGLCLVSSNSLSTLGCCQSLQPLFKFWVMFNLTSLTSEKTLELLFKLTNFTQRLIPSRNAWTMQIQDPVPVDSSSGNLHLFAQLRWYFAWKPYHLNGRCGQLISWTRKAIHAFKN